MDFEGGIGYSFIGTDQLVLDFHQLREIALDRFTGGWFQRLKFPEEHHSSDSSANCIHSSSQNRSHLSRVIDTFQLDLNFLRAGSTDNCCSVCSTIQIVGMNSAFSYGGGIESNRNVQLYFLAGDNVPCEDTLEDAVTAPLPGCIVCRFQEFDRSEHMLVGLIRHRGRSNWYRFGPRVYR